ncbi:nicotinate-nucleotide adenylyltransferase, partial [Lysobacter sp. A3-1-A15]
PHRAPPGASALHRARMLDLAVAGERGLAVDRRELARGGRSYSIETLREIRAELGDGAPVAWLVGADSFLDLPAWRDWQALFDLSHFVVAQRPGASLDVLPEALDHFVASRWTRDAGDLHASPAGRVWRLAQPLQAESGTQVRQAIAADADIDGLVAPAVGEYIHRHALYHSGPTHGSVTDASL